MSKRLIYDERRDPNCFFLLTGLVWGGLIAASALSVIGSSAVPPECGQVLSIAWEAGGVGGGFCLLLGLLVRAAAIRLVADKIGVRRLSVLGRDQWLFRWADVRSWHLESYREATYDMDGFGGEVTRTRLVVEQGPAQRTVLDREWHIAISEELRTRLPEREAAEPITAPDQPD